MGPHDLDISHVLRGELGHRNVQHIEILPAYQVKKQIQRALEGLQHDLQSVGRDE